MDPYLSRSLNHSSSFDHEDSVFSQQSQLKESSRDNTSGTYVRDSNKTDTEVYESDQRVFEYHDGNEDPRKKPWDMNEPFRHPPPGHGKHWAHIRQLGQNYDQELCDSWRDEVDKLLIFSGLFSAIVTAFLVESYKALKPDYAVASVAILADILDHIANNGTKTLQNSHGFLKASVLSPGPTLFETLVNIFWFLSLTVALATVAIGILCMQWIREYRKYGEISHHDQVEMRRMRYEGLLRWRVPLIFSILPTMLQTALAMFFLGLLFFLWPINHVVAIPVIIVIGIVLSFVNFTAMAPALQYCRMIGSEFDQCPYKSPQSWFCLEFLLLVIRLLRSYILPSCKSSTQLPSTCQDRVFTEYGNANWPQYDLHWRSKRKEFNFDFYDTRQELVWANVLYGQNSDVVHSIYHCIKDLPKECAADVVIKSNPDSAQAVHSFLASPPNSGSTNHDSHTLEAISGLFLRGHFERHPHLKLHLFELYIRHANTVDRMQKMLRYLLPNQVSPNSRNLGLSLQMCLAGEFAMSRNTLPLDYAKCHLESMRSLLERLLRLPSLSSAEQKPILDQISSSLTACEQWIRSASSQDSVDRAQVALEGLAYSSEEFILLVRFNNWAKSFIPDSDSVLANLSSLITVIRKLILKYDSNMESVSQHLLEPWGNLRDVVAQQYHPLTDNMSGTTSQESLPLA